MNSPALATCRTCGAQLSLDHLRGTDCPYCRTAFPHHARAAEHAALVNRVMHDNIAMTSPWLLPGMHGGAPQAMLGIAQVHQATSLAARSIQRAITIAVGVAIGFSILAVVLSAVLLG